MLLQVEYHLWFARRRSPLGLLSSDCGLEVDNKPIIFSSKSSARLPAFSKLNMKTINKQQNIINKIDKVIHIYSYLHCTIVVYNQNKRLKKSRACL